MTFSSPVATAEFSKFAGILLPRDLLAKKDVQLGGGAKMAEE